MINALSDFRVAAICDKASLVGTVIEKYGQLKYVAEFDDVLNIPDLHAVVIATPTTSHAGMAKRALDRGLHVFCEKPLTLSADSSTELTKAAAAKGLVGQVGYHNRFIGTFREIKRLLDGAALGRISHVQAEAYGPVVLKPSKPTWRGKAEQGGGCLYDYAAHPLNLLNWYVGATESCGGAILKSGYSAEVDDEVYSSLSFKDGVTGQLSVNWSDPSVRKMTTRITIWGEGGKIYADRQELQVFLTGGAPIPAGYSEGWTVKYTTDLTKPVSFYLRGEEYTAQLEAFGDAIKAGAGAVENGFASAAQTDTSIEMIRASALANAAVGGPLSAAPPRRAGLVDRLLGR
jgi:predicted dehydrogenase